MLATILILAACSPQPSGGDPIFKTENAFKGTPPESAETVSPEEFASLSKDPAFRWESEAARAARKQKADAQFQADKAQLTALADPKLARFLKSPGSSTQITFGGQHLIDVTDRNGKPFKVLTMGQRETYRELLSGRQRYLDKANQLSVYQSLYDSLSEGLKAGLPTPQELQSQSYEQVMAALGQAEQKLASNIEEIELRAERRGLPRSSIKTQADPNRPPGYPANANAEVEAGEGSDRTGNGCGPVAGGVYEKVHWAQKYFTTSIKNQGKRGSCVSFALTSALETQVAIRQARWVNLSEQYLYNRIKSVWDADDYGDGTDTADAAEEFHDSNYLLPFESQWNYNPSNDRVDHKDDEYYTKSCVGYDERCSNTTHQGKFVCTTVNNVPYCGSTPPNPGKDGYRISESHLLWSNGLFSGDIPVNTVRNLLSTGHPMVVAIEVYEDGFDPNAQGFITSYADDTLRGGHALHLVGYLSNSKIQAKIPNAPSGAGGGYFVIKNSWADCWGDGGYVYVPVNWANLFFKNITYYSAGNKSAEFTNKPPTVQITAPGNGLSFPYAQDITYKATATDPNGGNLIIRWSSDKDGDLGSGSQITKHFNSPGARTITAIAEDSLGFKSEPAIISVTGTNPAPTAHILTPLASATIYAGSTQVVFQGEGLDGNGSFPGPMDCDRLSWKSSVAGDALGSGCEFSHTFATTGIRTITLTATDEYGAKGTATLSLNVKTKPPVGPPVINISSPIDNKYYGAANTNIRLAYTMDDPGAKAGDQYTVVWTLKYGNQVKTITPKTCTIRNLPFACFNPSEMGYTDYGVKNVEISVSVTDAEGLTGTDKVSMSFGVVP
jgi:C1A family cysteine protease